MSDRELLDLAAKAAGFELAHTGENETVLWLIRPGSVEDCHGERPIFAWNPLVGDGDALRLAVQLKLDIAIDDYVQVSWWSGQGSLQWVNEECCRRAIVRAAAEIGKSLP